MTLSLDMTAGKKSALIQESRSTLECYNLDDLKKFGLNQDPRTYCFTATYPPLKALLDDVGPSPFSSRLPDIFRLYVHFPFCTGRCSFCHFNVVTAAEEQPIKEYLDALELEIKQLAPLATQSQASSVYFGGGTPSLLSPEQLSRIIGLLRDGILISPQSSFTLEVHPEVVIHQGNRYLADLIALGINRISIGVQDFNERVLSATGRRHNSQQAESVIAEALDLGLTVNVDLLSPLPHQTPESWEETLEKAFSAGVTSVTMYTTSIRETMAVSSDIRKGIPFPSQNDSYLFYVMAQKMAERFAYTERSSRWFYKKTAVSERNRAAFAHEPLLGLGCGAYGFINDVQYFNLPTPSAYLTSVRKGQAPTWKSMLLSETERLHRELVFSARDGRIHFGKFRVLFGIDVRELFREKWEILLNLELLVSDGQSFQLTDKGRMLSDEIASFFIGPEVLQSLSRGQTQTSGRWGEHLNHFYDLRGGE